MEQRIRDFLKKPRVVRSIYMAGCMIISFSLGIITKHHLSERGNTSEIMIPTQPIPMALRYGTPAATNVYDFMPAEEGINESTVSADEPIGAFVASKSGTKYYPEGCGGISRIKPENRIYFATEKEAEEKGYERTTTCQ